MRSEARNPVTDATGKSNDVFFDAKETFHENIEEDKGNDADIFVDCPEPETKSRSPKKWIDAHNCLTPLLLLYRLAFLATAAAKSTYSSWTTDSQWIGHVGHPDGRPDLCGNLGTDLFAGSSCVQGFLTLLNWSFPLGNPQFSRSVVNNNYDPLVLIGQRLTSTFHYQVMLNLTQSVMPGDFAAQLPLEQCNVNAGTISHWTVSSSAYLPPGSCESYKEKFQKLFTDFANSPGEPFPSWLGLVIGFCVTVMIAIPLVDETNASVRIRQAGTSCLSFMRSRLGTHSRGQPEEDNPLLATEESRLGQAAPQNTP